MQKSQPSTPFVHSLRRGLSQALPTMDRRAFLRRSGLGVGVGWRHRSSPLVKKAKAAAAPRWHRHRQG
jgi:formate dehydrogenase major subunit